MDDKILEILMELKEGQTRLETNINNIDGRLDRIETDIKDIKNKLDITYDQVARTAEDVISIKDDMSTVETVTAKNWADIVKLKSVK